MNYTKGDWEITDSAFSRFTTYRKHRTGGRTFVTTLLSRELIAEAQGDTQEEAEANAHLIAASPDMYEALRQAWALLATRCHIPAIKSAADICGKALAKAEGKEVKP